MEEKLKRLLEELMLPTPFEDCLDSKTVLGGDGFRELLPAMMEEENGMQRVLTMLSSKIKEFEPFKACCAAYFCGSIIEQSGLGESGPALTEYYSELMEACDRLLQAAAKKIDCTLEELESEDLTIELLEELEPQIPDEVRAFLGSGAATLAIMDVITRDGTCRMQLRKQCNFELLDRLKNFVPNVNFVTQVYTACFALPLLVLLPETGQGLLAEVNDINNCFNLITFLEAELYRNGLSEKYLLRGYQFNEEIYRCCTGEQMPYRGGSVSAHQQYYTYLRLGKTGTLNELVRYMIWGEMPPENIPRMNNKTAVMVMDPDTLPSGGRSWGTEFLFCCHHGLKPSVRIIRELSGEEVQKTLKELEDYAGNME